MSPEEAKRSQQLEQSLASARDLIPRLWRQIYLGCVRQGFTPDEAFKLTQTYIMSVNNQNGMQPPHGLPQPPEDEE